MQLGCRFLDDGKSQTGAFILLSGVKSVKNAEDLIVVPQLDPDAVVTDEKLVVVVPNRLPAYFDLFVRSVVELHGISDEILKNLPKQGPLGIDSGKIVLFEPCVLYPYYLGEPKPGSYEGYTYAVHHWGASWI